MNDPRRKFYEMSAAPAIAAGDMLHAEYIGPKEEWKGEFALVRVHSATLVLAQFDNTGLTDSTGKIRYGYGWHHFDPSAFDLAKAKSRKIQSGDPV